ncbi:MAG: hypothetical protein J0L86_05375 [Flavobacteriales bacterium]|nr:hypothetical protein [Flavobacteriales bacterium]
MNNIKLWFEQSEPDYYLFFLKAWIPFNAWYVNEYPLLKKKDKEIIKELQDDINSKPKIAIQNFLENNQLPDSTRFQSYLAELHYQLDNTSVKHNGYRLSFKEIPLTENPIKHLNKIDENHSVYKVERTSSYFQAYVEAKGGRVKIDFKKPIYDLEELTKDSDYIRLEKKEKDILYKLFEKINPKKPISLISNSPSKKNCIVLNSTNTVKFIEDTEIVAKGIIKVLYYLRCMLFHGEITPNSTNKKIYENAYYLLLLINKKLN